jgi:sugar/nucleoside kinase (ribokinase family)
MKFFFMFTSRQFILYITGENAIVIVAGANAMLTEQDVLDAECLIKNSTVVVCQLEIRPSVTLAALKLARKHGGIVRVHIVLKLATHFRSTILQLFYHLLAAMPVTTIRCARHF